MWWLTRLMRLHSTGGAIQTPPILLSVILATGIVAVPLAAAAHQAREVARIARLAIGPVGEAYCDVRCGLCRTTKAEVV